MATRTVDRVVSPAPRKAPALITTATAMQAVMSGTRTRVMIAPAVSAENHIDEKRDAVHGGDGRDLEERETRLSVWSGAPRAVRNRTRHDLFDRDGRTRRYERLRDRTKASYDDAVCDVRESERDAVCGGDRDVHRAGGWNHAAPCYRECREECEGHERQAEGYGARPCKDKQGMGASHAAMLNTHRPLLKRRSTIAAA